MLSCPRTGNISGEATTQPGNIFNEAMRHIALWADSIEGLNNKIRVIQRRTYGLHGEEYLKLKILTCTLAAL